MLVNLATIMSVKDKVEHIEAPLTGKSINLDGIEYEFGSKNPVLLTIRHLGNRKVKVEGSTSLSLMIPCGRCLQDVETFFDIDISKDLDFNDTNEDRIRELDETNYVIGYTLDVDKLVGEEILINLPLKVLCKEDCKGLCNVCGKNHNIESCNCEDTSLDPRMAGIQDIFNNFKEV